MSDNPFIIGEVEQALRARLAECERERDGLRRTLEMVAPGLDPRPRADGPMVQALTAERDTAIQRAAAAEGKVRETTYAALAARGQGEADTVARIAAWLDDPEGEPISHEMLRCYGLQDYSQRVETCRDMLAEMIKAGAWRGKEGV